jgi:L-ectoine synthase
MYLLDKNDEHWLRGKEKGMTVACVFSPALTGREVHREDGSYAPADD